VHEYLPERIAEIYKTLVGSMSKELLDVGRACARIRFERD
jgi:hypothetical protein